MASSNVLGARVPDCFIVNDLTGPGGMFGIVHESTAYATYNDMTYIVKHSSPHFTIGAILI